MNFFKTHSNCILVRGATRSLICDLQRQESDFIPNDLVEVLNKLNKKRSVENILEDHGIKNKEIINDYLEYLYNREYGFFCSEEEFDRFPILNTEYKCPSSITNIVVELRKINIPILESLIPQFEKLGCKDIVIVFYETLNNIDDYKEIFIYLKNTIIKSVEIISQFTFKVDEKLLNEINQDLNQLTRLIFYSADYDKIEHWDDKLFFDRVYSTNHISSFKSCGIISPKYFNINLPKFVEALNHNSCLNRKLSIDINGEIRNCPSMTKSFGNVKETSLKQAVNHPEFKKYWNITKDQIEICKDCEFRYVCTDCRAYKENPEDDYSKPLKCGYNPYTNEWEEWSTNPLKEKAIEYYGMQGLVKKDA